MESIAKLIIIIIIFIFILTSLIAPIQSSDSCKTISCDESFGPTIRFPFRLKNRQPLHCGYDPFFDLYCNDKKQTLINLPGSGEFEVNYISYDAQALFINDPDSCLPNRIVNFTLSGSPFQGVYLRNYTFLNCSSNWMDLMENTTTYRYIPLLCMSGTNYTILATNSHLSRLDTDELGPSCSAIVNVSVPIMLTVSEFYLSSIDLREDLELVWTEPMCSGCEAQGRACGFNDGSGQEVGCIEPSRTGLPRGLKYGLIVGVGIPGLACIIVLVCYACGLIRAFSLRRHLNTDLPMTTFSDQRQSVRAINGLDGPTINSFPKTVLSESRRILKPSDVTCPICLCEYQPKETLRSIPECDHYFHVDCIDEWLKLNGTCPLCRNYPDSSTATPDSSASSSASPSTLSTTSEDR